MVASSRKTSALAITLILPVLFWALIILVTEQPLWRFAEPAPSRSRAALALRDDVIPFQKWGTRVFTLPYLERYYDATYYFTESGGDTAELEAFIAALTQALIEYDEVDVYLLAHSNWYIDWVATIDPALRSKLRLVYNTGCYNADQAQAWLQLGAQTAIAHPGISDSPIFYFYFLRRWTLGTSLDQAVDSSNEQMRGVFNRVSLVTLGYVDAVDRYSQSQALCYGNCVIRIGD